MLRFRILFNAHIFGTKRLECSQMSGVLSECNKRFRFLHLLYDVEIMWRKTINPRGGDSHMKQTGMLVGNFEFNP